LLKGQKEYESFKQGKKLTHKQMILAQCYVCNGLEEGGEDCLGKSCPLYPAMPYRRDRTKKKATPEQLERLKRAREARG